MFSRNSVGVVGHGGPACYQSPSDPLFLRLEISRVQALIPARRPSTRGGVVAIEYHKLIQWHKEA